MPCPMSNCCGGTLCLTAFYQCNAIKYAGATVTIKQGTTTVDTGTTDSNGKACFSLPAGSYSWTIARPGYTSLTGTSTVTAGNTTNSGGTFSDPNRVCACNSQLPSQFCSGTNGQDGIAKALTLNDGRGDITLTWNGIAGFSGWSGTATRSSSAVYPSAVAGGCSGFDTRACFGTPSAQDITLTYQLTCGNGSAFVLTVWYPCCNTSPGFPACPPGLALGVTPACSTASGTGSVTSCEPFMATGTTTPNNGLTTVYPATFNWTVTE